VLDLVQIELIAGLGMASRQKHRPKRRSVDWLPAACVSIFSVMQLNRNRADHQKCFACSRWAQSDREY
jgi:hypothetical protein